MDQKRGIGESAGDYIGLGLLVAIVAGVVWTAEATIGAIIVMFAAAFMLVGVVAKGVEVGIGAADRNRAELEASSEQAPGA